MPDLSVKYVGLQLKNPFVAAGGTPTKTIYGMKKLIEAGIAGIEWKCVTWLEDTWVLPRPANLFLDKYGLSGSIASWETGFVSPEESLEQVREIKPLAMKENVKLIVNLDLSDLLELGGKSAATIRDWVEYGKKAEKIGADILQFGGICPCIGVSIYDSLTLFEEFYLPWYDKTVPEIIKAFRKAGIKLPITVKNGLDYARPVQEVVKKLEDAGADGVHISGGLIGTSINVETGMPVNPGNPTMFGWGQFLRPLATVTAAKASLAVNKMSIMSSGGISDWRDAVERLMCGATCAAVCTAIMYRGFKVISQMLTGMDKFMERKGYKDPADFIGIAAPYVDNPKVYADYNNKLLVSKESIMVTVDPMKCNGCERCVDCCMYGALSMQRDKAIIDQDICERCGVCSSVCPVNAIFQPWPSVDKIPKAKSIK